MCLGRLTRIHIDSKLFAMNVRSTAIVNAGLLFFIFLVFLFMLVLYYYNKKWKSVLKEKMMMEKIFAEELSATQFTIREETFRSISQEIHDNIGQSLSLVKLNMLTTNPGDSAQVAETLEASRRLLSKTMHDLRNLAHSMNPDFLASIGLPAAIRQQLEQLKHPGGYQTFFMCTEAWPQRNIQKEFVILRVVQELLNNIVKHAAATEVQLYIQYLEEELLLVVKDNGKGFNPTAYTGNGMGLTGIAGRLKKIGGTIKFESHALTGTTVFVLVYKE